MNFKELFALANQSYKIIQTPTGDVTSAIAIETAASFMFKN